MDERDPRGRVRVLPTVPLASAPLGPRPENLVDRRTVLVCVLAIGIALAASLAAQALTRLIWTVTHLAFFGRLAASAVSPADNHLGPAVILVPVVGGALVGLMVRYGSPAIRGHGIPEAMEQILTNGSRIPPPSSHG